MTRTPGTLAVLLLEQQTAFEAAAACHVFAAPPPGYSGGWYDVRLCGIGGTEAMIPLRASFDHAGMSGAFQLRATHGLDGLASADTVLVCGTGDTRTDPPEPVLAAIRAARAHRARMVSL